MLLDYNTWESYKDSLKIIDLPKEVHSLFSVLDNYHTQNAAKTPLTVGDLGNLLFASSTKDKEYYLGVLEQLEKLEVSKDTTETLIKSLLSHRKLKEISLAAYDVTEGRQDLSKLMKLLKDFTEQQEQQETKEEFDFVSDNLQELADEAIKQHGLRWRLDTLNKILGSLRVGDFGFIFARPETGKTTFLASEVTYMAEQLSNDSGPIIWFKYRPL